MTHTDKEALGQLNIAGATHRVTISYGIDCDREVCLSRVIIDENGIDILDSWIWGQELIEQCEDIVWIEENPARDYGE